MSRSFIIPLYLRKEVILSVHNIECSATAFCPAGVHLTSQSLKLGLVKITQAFTHRPLRLCKIPGHDHVAANVPVHFRTRIVGLVAIQVGGQSASTVVGGGNYQLTTFRRSARCRNEIFGGGGWRLFYSSNWPFSLRRRARTRNGLPPSPRIHRRPERGGTHGHDQQR